MSDHADTIREHYTQVCHCEWSEDEFTRTLTSEHCVIHGSAPDPLATLLSELERKDEALRFYAERKNYRLAGGDPRCPEHGGYVCALEHRDSHDGGGPGARARIALAAAGPEQGATP